MATATRRLGEVLIERGLVKAWQLDAALQTQRTTKEFLGTILVKKGWLTEAALLSGLAEQFNMPHVHVTADDVDWQVAGKYSPALLTEHHCLALRCDGRSVTVAIANPLDAWAISELEQRAGVRALQLVLASAEEIQEAIRVCHQRALRALNNQIKRASGEGSPDRGL